MAGTGEVTEKQALLLVAKVSFPPCVTLYTSHQLQALTAVQSSLELILRHRSAGKVNLNTVARVWPSNPPKRLIFLEISTAAVDKRPPGLLPSKRLSTDQKKRQNVSPDKIAWHRLTCLLHSSVSVNNKSNEDLTLSLCPFCCFPQQDGERSTYCKFLAYMYHTRYKEVDL